MSSDDERLLSRMGQALRDRQGREEAAASEGLPRELTEPLPASFREALAERALQTLGPARAAPAVAARPIASARPRRRWLAPSFVLALGAAAAAWMMWRAPALPAYALALEGGDAPLRGAPAAAGPGRVTLARDSRLELVLRPATPVEGAVQARIYLAGDPPVPLDAAVEVAPSGAVRWSGTAEQLVGARTGEVDLLVVVGRPAALPAPGELARQPEGGRTWQRFRVPLRVVVSER